MFEELFQQPLPAEEPEVSDCPHAGTLLINVIANQIIQLIKKQQFD